MLKPLTPITTDKPAIKILISESKKLVVKETFSDLVKKLNESSASTEKIDEEYTIFKDQIGNTMGGYNKGKNVSYIFKNQKDGCMKYVDMNNDGKIDKAYKSTKDKEISYDVVN